MPFTHSLSGEYTGRITESFIFKLFSIPYRFMRTFLSCLVALITLSSLSATAQKADSVTREELTRYVMMMDSVETLKIRLTETTSKLASGNAKISPARYNQLLSIINNTEKLAEAKATTDEIEYVKKTVAIRTEETLKLQNAFTALMNEYVGYDTFNKVRKAIADNPTVKARYEAELAKRKGDR